MAIETPIFAAIVGSVVAGVISFVINVFALGGQYLLHRRNRKEMNRFQWRNETVPIVRELRREALRMDLTGDIPDGIEDLVEDVESQIDMIPPKYQGERLNSYLDNIVLAKNKFDTSYDDLTLPEFRQELVENTESALDEFENISNSSTSMY